MYNKAWYKSKTMWASILVAFGTTMFPAAKEIVEQNPQIAMGVIGGIFGLLRITTKAKLEKK
jgi:hypothetical protein